MAAVEKPKDKKYSKEEYFIMEEKASEKHEFHDGEILMMSGGSGKHSLLGARIGAMFTTAFLEKGCYIFNSDMKVELAKFNQYVYPDTSVVCGEINYVQGREDVIDNPIIIVEVLSPSTESYDRGLKFFKYRSLDSLKVYILISQELKFVEVFTKNQDKIWQMESFHGDEKEFKLLDVEGTFSIDFLYQRIL